MLCNQRRKGIVDALATALQRCHQRARIDLQSLPLSAPSLSLIERMPALIGATLH